MSLQRVEARRRELRDQVSGSHGGSMKFWIKRIGFWPLSAAAAAAYMAESPASNARRRPIWSDKFPTIPPGTSSGRPVSASADADSDGVQPLQQDQARRTQKRNSEPPSERITTD